MFTFLQIKVGKIISRENVDSKVNACPILFSFGKK